MKIFKEKQHSFFPRPLGIRDKYYLSVGVMAFFDLNDPDSLLDEQELWKTVPTQLGPKPIIDQGVPKPRGEFLVSGSCFAPRGQSRPASQVQVRIGDKEKKLNIFGDRYWKKGLFSEPEPFVEMPLVWANGFGGPDYPKNPLGKGMGKVLMHDGSEAVPLPNIELPQQQIGSPSQKPDPAGFGPLDLMWPQRAQKNGTYDEKWKNERWPFFPDDMNYEFFNAASADQFMDGYFKGGEPVEIKNMHPDFPLIESALPSLRMRCFVTVNKNFKPHKFPVGPLPSHQISEDEEFREVSTRLETVWFFPSIMRGLLIYRGTTEVVDDEGADVLRVMIRHEEQSTEPKPLEHYRDLQIKLLDRGVDIDMSKAEEAMQKAKKTLVKVKNIPKFADEIRQKALGNRPAMPMQDPEEVVAGAQKMIAGHYKTLDSLESMARKAHAEHGHLVEINLGVFDKFRGKIADLEKKLSATGAKFSATKKQLEASRKAAVKESSAKLKGIKPEYLKQNGLDPDEPISAEFPFHKKVNPWHDRGFPLVVRWRRALENDRESMKKLTDLGLDRKTIKRMWLGVNDEGLTETPADWGLDGDDDFSVPAGLVLPRFDGPVLNHIKSNPGRFAEGKELLVPGSNEDALFLPSATLIDLPSMVAAAAAPVVCVADELQAMFMEQKVGDFCSILTLGSPKDKPGKDAAKELKKALAVLIVRPEKWSDDRDLKAGWADWKSALKTAQPLELEHGRTVFESSKKGSDIRQWVLDHLPEEYGAEHSISMSMPEKGSPPDENFLKGFMPPFPDVKGLAKGIHAEVKKSMEAKFAPLKAEQETLLIKMREKAVKYAKYGTDPSKVVLGGAKPKQSPAELGKDIAAKIRSRAADLKQRNLLSPEVAAKMESEAANAEKAGAKLDAHKADLLKKFEAKKIELAEGLKKLEAKELPDDAAAKLAEHGLSADSLRVLTREEVQRYHEQGKSLVGAVLSGVDLSGLDLSNVDLSKCQLQKTNFKGTILDGSKLIQALGVGADFSKASLKGVDLGRGVFSKALFKESDLSGTIAAQAIFKGADFSKAVLHDANFDMAILEKTDFTEADLKGVRINMCMISGRADRSDFSQSTIKKSIFKSSSLNHANFSEASVNESLFNDVEAHKTDFTDANLDKLRTGRNSQFKDSDFRNATLRGAALRESDFTGSDFRGADFENGLIDNSQLVRANLNGVSAKGARFTKSNLEAASMRAANIHMGGMRKARLVDTDLRGSNLFAVDFYKSVLGDTRFEAANLKRSQLHGKLELLDDDS
ncbi:DUF2169 domain-containing protein [Desulfovibrio sp. JC022]|uniref:DUF2169 family type VI secretion system accessory protein n=1 Tax=Desulfovibrio sp. JC022 TaxID=2593642 RepID=UPI0013CF4762|nr:DUF2169 domain-containing protein [Desulfovibrio sp. JC022]NDV23345.1 DUF2169 domain-containing protein [Desulfovibrio sp. JC022]